MEFLTTTTPETTLPVSVADLKTHMRITTSSDDDYITDLAWMAYAWIESEADITIGTTVYQLQSDVFPSSLPQPPVQSISSISYYDTDNTSQSLTEGTDYYLIVADKQAALLEPVETWPSVYARPDAVTIAFTAGFTSPHKQVLVLHLMRLLVGSAYEFREGEIAGTIISQVKLGIDRLMNQIKNRRYV